MTVTAQFQQSLHSLMDTLNQANPFFIRCIKSNGDKVRLYPHFIATSSVFVYFVPIIIFCHGRYPTNLMMILFKGSYGTLEC